MYFTKGRRRQYERLMQERPGFDHSELSDEETKKQGMRKHESCEAGQSKRSRRMEKDRKFPGNEDGRWKK